MRDALMPIFPLSIRVVAHTQRHRCKTTVPTRTLDQVRQFKSLYTTDSSPRSSLGNPQLLFTPSLFSYQLLGVSNIPKTSIIVRLYNRAASTPTSVRDLGHPDPSLFCIAVHRARVQKVLLACTISLVYMAASHRSHQMKKQTFHFNMITTQFHGPISPAHAPLPTLRLPLRSLPFVDLAAG